MTAVKNISLEIGPFRSYKREWPRRTVLLVTIMHPVCHRDRALVGIIIVMAQRRHHAVDNTGVLVQAVEYVRMSTDHQQYSTENQHDAIQRFADANGISIVRSFIDAGKSGVGIQGRDALQDLLRTVESGQANFSTILVYDVSRWGRFQEPDEGAYYEFRCIRANITVQYCAEPSALRSGVVDFFTAILVRDTTPIEASRQSMKRESRIVI